MQMMRKLYNEMIQEKAGIKGEALVQIGAIKREKIAAKKWRWLNRKSEVSSQYLIESP